MGKIIYVNGSILVITPKFHCKEAACGYDTNPYPDKAVVIEGDLTITDDNLFSIFDEFHAKTDFVTNCDWKKYLYRDIDEALSDFNDRIEDIRKVFMYDIHDDVVKVIVKRLSYVSIVASLDTFVCDAVLFCLVNNEELFSKYIEYIYDNSSDKLQNKILRMIDNNPVELEWYIIDKVMNASYSSVDTIKKLFRGIGLSIEDNEGRIGSIFKKRHCLAHRNGRKEDGSYIVIEIAELKMAIKHISNFVDKIVEVIKVTQ